MTAINEVIPHPLDNQLESAIDEFLTNTGDPEAEATVEPRREPFRIQDDGAASWAMNRLNDVRAEVASKRLYALEQIERVQIWLDAEIGRHANRDAFFVNILEDYARRQRESANRKTINLPHGKVTSTATQPKWEVNDEVFLAWAHKNSFGDLIKVTEEPKLAEMKKLLQQSETRIINVATGEVTVTTSNKAVVLGTDDVVDGVVILPPRVNITVKTEADQEKPKPKGATL